MKHLILILFFMLSMFTMSCSNESTMFDLIDSNSQSEMTQSISFICKGDFHIESITNMTRSTNINGSTDIWVFDYMGDELMQMNHQNSSDTNFGNLTLNLKYGQHRLCFVISDGYMPVVDTSIKCIRWNIPGDTYHASYDINVDKNSSKIEIIEMQRITSKLTIKIQGKIPNNADAFRFHPQKWFYSIIYTSGVPANDRDMIFNTNVSNEYRGTDNEIEYSYYTFSKNFNYTTCAYISFLNNNEDIVNAYLSSIYLECGKVTTFTGSFNYGETDISFIFNIPDWINGQNNEF